MIHQPPVLGLYIHIPWCIKKCPYCDFNSHAVTDGIPEKRYTEALLRDLEQELPAIRNRQIHTIFFGGGTPSLFTEEAIHELIQAISKKVSFSADIEITLEANPGTVEKGRFKGFMDAGVNRLSIGVQSFQPAHLKSLGRIHSAGEAVLATEEARAAGIDNFNLDLMYGLPNQTRAEAADDVQKAIALEPSHISYYQLTIEAHTRFASFPPSLPSDDEIWDIQSENRSTLAEHGYSQYEVSAYAKIGCRCRHNMNYWTFGDYIGIGAGAHGKFTEAGSVHRSWKTRHPEQYLKTAGTPASIGKRTCISSEDIKLEFLMNALRLSDGFEKGLFRRRTGLELSALEPQLTQCIEESLIEQDANHIRCTNRGQTFLDEILRRFIPE